jgi:hypothetical protein
VIPSLFSIVDDVRKRFGRLDVEGEGQPVQDVSFADTMCRELGDGRPDE